MLRDTLRHRSGHTWSKCEPILRKSSVVIPNNHFRLYVVMLYTSCFIVLHFYFISSSFRIYFFHFSPLWHLFISHYFFHCVHRSVFFVFIISCVYSPITCLILHSLCLIILCSDPPSCFTTPLSFIICPSVYLPFLDSIIINCPDCSLYFNS